MSSLKLQCLDESLTQIFLVDSMSGIKISKTELSINSSTGSLVLNGGLSINNTTDSQSYTQGGSITIGGGCSIGKKLYIGDDIYINGDIYNNGVLYSGSSQWLNTPSTSKIYYELGNVGIGTTNPNYELDIIGDINFTGQIYKNGEKYYLSPWFVDGNNILYTSGNIGIGTTQPSATLDINGSVNINLTSAESFIITGEGNVGIGTNTPNYKLDLNGDMNITGDILKNGQPLFQVIWNNINNTNDIAFTSGNVGIGTTSPEYKLHVDGDIYVSEDIITFSDETLKTDISTINNAVDKLKDIRGVYYTHKKTQKRSIGVIAQEVKNVLPEIITTEGNYLGVAYGNMVGVLIEAIKELSQRVENLQNNY